MSTASHVYTSIADFTITGLLGGTSQGSHGVIVNAVRNADRKEFVMKFFGYTRNKPDVSWIVREIDNLKALHGIQGKYIYPCLFLCFVMVIIILSFIYSKIMKLNNEICVYM